MPIVISFYQNDSDLHFCFIYSWERKYPISVDTWLVVCQRQGFHFYNIYNLYLQQKQQQQQDYVWCNRWADCRFSEFRVVYHTGWYINAICNLWGGQYNP